MRLGSLIPSSFRGPYRTLLIAAVLGPALLFAAIAVWSWTRVKAETVGDIGRVTDLLHEDALKLVQTAALIIDRIDDRVAGLGWPAIADRTAELDAFLERIPAPIDGIEAVFIADEAGTVRARSRPAERANVADRLYFTQVREGPGIFVDGPLASGPGAPPIIAVARRLSSADGAFRGAAVAVIAAKYLSNAWGRIVASGDTVSLVCDDGKVLARYPEIPVSPDGAPAHFSDETMTQLRGSDHGILESVSAIDGIARIDGYRRLGAYPFHIVYAVDRRNLEHQWYPILAAFAAAAAAASAGLVLTALVVIRRARGEAEALAAAAASEVKYRALFLKAPTPMIGLDSERRIIDVNNEWLRALGYAREEVLGRTIDSFHPRGAEPVHEARWRELMEKGTLRDADRRYVRKNGEIMETRISAILERDAEGRFVRVITGVTDLTARRRAEEAAERERQFSELLVESSTEGIVGVDRELRYTVWNPRMEQISGIARQQVIGRAVTEMFPHLAGGRIETAWREALAGRHSGVDDWAYHYPQTGKSGYFDQDFAPLLDQHQNIVGAIGFIRDITARRRAEEALRQSQKMEVIGQLTGGVAHDFNNLLTVIIGNIDTLRRRLGAVSGEVERSINGALRGATRAATLTQRLLAFARRQPLDPQPVNLNKLVAGTSELLRRTIGERISVETVLAGGLWLVSADATQIESALLNLAVNARDAMPDGGKLTIETANTFLDEAYAATHAEVVPGQYAMLAVTDTGFGMTEEIKGKVFEPFFTTKAVGHGTGLGLSQVYGFIKQSGGHVTIYSEPGEGTSVKLYLPRLVPGEGRREGEPTAAAVAMARSETILVVEDDEDVRRHSVGSLSELGYRVVEAADAAQALGVIEREEKVDLMFTDVGLPGELNGRQLADAVRGRDARIKVLFTTGYARNAIVHQGRLDPGVDLLVKPFTFELLAAKIRQVLDGTSRP